MLDHNSPKLRMLRGKTVYDVKMHGSHGEVLELIFNDGTTLRVSTTEGTEIEKISSVPHDICVCIDDLII